MGWYRSNAGDSCYNDFSMGYIEDLIADHLGEGTYVTSLCFGDSLAEVSSTGNCAAWHRLRFQH